MTLDVHSRDVLTQLCEQGVTQVMDFKWLCQLRYYWIVSRFKHVTSLLIFYDIHMYICHTLILNMHIVKRSKFLFLSRIGRKLAHDDDKL